MAAINSKGTNLNFKYGRMEFEAKLPKGDWLVPFVELYPEDNFYGSDWPKSGIFQAFKFSGNQGYDCGWTDYGRKCGRSKMFYGVGSGGFSDPGDWMCGSNDLSDDFHKYKIIWDQTKIQTFVEDQLIFEKSFPAGGLCGQESWCNNGNNPYKSGGRSAPFDRNFYLKIGMMVGGGTSFFPDNCDNLSGQSKPWTGNGTPRQFWWGGRPNYNDDRDSFETWSDPVFKIKEIVVYNE